MLDPWSPGGIHTSLSDSVIAIQIEDGAHHLDLRFSNPADPPSVIAARITEKKMISSWLNQRSSVNSANYSTYNSKCLWLKTFKKCNFVYPDQMISSYTHRWWHFRLDPWSWYCCRCRGFSDFW